MCWNMFDNMEDHLSITGAGWTALCLPVRQFKSTDNKMHHDADILDRSIIEGKLGQHNGSYSWSGLNVLKTSTKDVNTRRGYPGLHQATIKWHYTIVWQCHFTTLCNCLSKTVVYPLCGEPGLHDISTWDDIVNGGNANAYHPLQNYTNDGNHNLLTDGINLYLTYKKLSIIPQGSILCHQIIKHLRDISLHALLDLFNDIWDDGVFPPGWREATIIPIPNLEKTILIPQIISW